MKYGLGSMMITLSGALTSSPAQAHTDDALGYWHHGWDWNWSHMTFGWLWMLVILGGGTLLVVLLAWWLSHRSKDIESSSSQQSPTLELLQERYARGDIDKGELEQFKRLFSG